MLKRINVKLYAVLFCLMLLAASAFSQKLDKEFKSFYKGFQRNVEADRIDEIKQVMCFPFQTIYWIDDLNTLSEEEKSDGLIDAQEFEQYRASIFNEDVKRIVAVRDAEQVQQIDVASSGDYYKRLANLIDPGSTLLELYCQYGENSTVGDDYFAFVFGKIKGEYRILSYYTNTRIKE
ncbi:hypothetical protein [Olivibacter sp. XZL3]|uniref:hypothetical protein n=1 Tax=Olivibacter sp. XZL3 TaxID=1735116 RepID=UPI0010648688|nr:hypothetical protein [Olivibacter sp. XZL3]